MTRFETHNEIAKAALSVMVSYHLPLGSFAEGIDVEVVRRVYLDALGVWSVVSNEYDELVRKAEAKILAEKVEARRQQDTPPS